MDKSKIKQLRNRTLLLIVIIIAIVGGLRTYDDLKRNNEIFKIKNTHIKEEILHEYYNEIDKIRTIIKINGQTFSKTAEVIKLFKNRDKEGLYEFIKPSYLALDKSFSGKTIIHFHTPDHLSFLRVHLKDKSGDNLKEIRPMVAHAIKTRKQIEGHEHGLHDKKQITYRMVFPIFDKDQFLGVVEIGIDTSYVVGKIEKLVDILFNTEIQIVNVIKEDTPNFDILGDFQGKVGGYVYKQTPLLNQIFKNSDNTLKEQKIHVDNKIYYLNFADIELKNYKGETIGNYYKIVDVTNDIKQNNLFFYSSLAKPIIAAILIVLLVGWIFYYFYKNFLELEKRTRNILDAQSSIIILSNGENIIDCNSALLNFYGFSSLEKFKEHYDCICDSFEEGDNLLQKEKNGELWIDQLIKNDKGIYKVGIKDKNGKINIFNIILNTYSKDTQFGDSFYVITLTNISDLERANAQIIEQSKQASLGEMIGNISHQWRQPLSVISTIASSIKLQHEMDQLEIKKLSENMDSIITKTDYLSETIDTFRNFIKETKVRKNIVLQDRINIALNILESSLASNHIKLIKDIQTDNPIQIDLVIGELSQVIINIINNAKDAIIENNVDDGFIKVSLDISKDEVTITIEDNGGGIPEDIISKIFEPYFTTKHQSQGTGLGLYMSYKIVVESLNGKIYVNNTDEGSKFFIKLPL